ncbi:VirB3 family type IV secretion system protein [Dyella marensis]|uniref:conjugal transfer protein TrbD n=1 Tax=Dyella marensis TaxID=500610 RepID=UPI0031D77AFB
MAVRTVPIRRAGNRDNLFLGGDREMVMFAGVIAVALVFSAQQLKALIAGAVIWCLSLFVLRLMAKSDPKLRQVYLRQRRYRRYYPARSTPFRVNGAAEEWRYR